MIIIERDGLRMVGFRGSLGDLYVLLVCKIKHHIGLYRKEQGDVKKEIK